MAMTYTKLIGARTTDGSLKSFVNWDLLPSEEVVSEAEATIYRRLRVRQMLQSTTGSLAQSADTVTLPSNFKAPYSLMFTGVEKKKLTHKRIEEVEDAWEYDGAGARVERKPEIFAPTGTVIQFDSKADQAYPYFLRYYGSLDPLDAAANQTNFLTNEYPSLLRHACLAIAYEKLKNPTERALQIQLFEKEVFEANQESDFALLGVEMNMEVD